MAVIFAVVGGGAVIAIASSDYSDRSYTEHSDYGNYSDEAERRRRRMDAKKQEIEGKKQEVNAYKLNSVNEYLHTDSLIQQSGVSVSIPEVQKDGNATIERDQTSNIDRESAQKRIELNEINQLIGRIDQILQEEN